MTVTSQYEKVRTIAISMILSPTGGYVIALLGAHSPIVPSWQLTVTLSLVLGWI